MLQLYKLKRAYKKDFLEGSVGGRRKGDGFKLKEVRFRLDIRKIFFTIRVVKHQQVVQRDGGCPIPRNIQEQD